MPRFAIFIGEDIKRVQVRCARTTQTNKINTRLVKSGPYGLLWTLSTGISDRFANNTAMGSKMTQAKRKIYAKHIAKTWNIFRGIGNDITHSTRVWLASRIFPIILGVIKNWSEVKISNWRSSIANPSAVTVPRNDSLLSFNFQKDKGERGKVVSSNICRTFSLDKGVSTWKCLGPGSVLGMRLRLKGISG